MVRYQIAGRGIEDEKVIKAMGEVPRHLFVPDELSSSAYADAPLPIGYGQTISQPYMVAIMTELLELEDSDVVLELGTGSGYQAAVIAKIAGFVRSYERIPELAEYGRRNLERAGISNVEIILSDGTEPLPYGDGYDAAIITAASPKIPEFLYPFMKDGGRIVVPVGDHYVQELLRIVVSGGRPSISHHGNCRFVPLIGIRGWEE